MIAHRPSLDDNIQLTNSKMLFFYWRCVGSNIHRAESTKTLIGPAPGRVPFYKTQDRKMKSSEPNKIYLVAELKQRSLIDCGCSWLAVDDRVSCWRPPLFSDLSLTSADSIVAEWRHGASSSRRSLFNYACLFRRTDEKGNDSNFRENIPSFRTILIKRNR